MRVAKARAEAIPGRQAPPDHHRGDVSPAMKASARELVQRIGKDSVILRAPPSARCEIEICASRSALFAER